MLIITRGSIYHWKHYNFEDGSHKDKYWISLTCKIGDFPKHIILPTSQIEKYEANQRSFIDTYVIQEGHCEFFKKDTVLDFKNIREELESQIKQAHDNGKFDYIGQLKQTILDNINDVIKNAETLSPELIEKLLCK